ALYIIGLLALAPFTERPVTFYIKNFNYSTPWEFCKWVKRRIAHRRTWLLHYTDEDTRFCRRILNELLDFGLLEKRDKGWQVSHALIYVYVRSKIPLNRIFLKGLAQFYIAFAQEQSTAGRKGYVRLDGERVHCLRLIRACLDGELWEEVKGLADAIWEYLDRQGHWADQLTALDMRLTAARKAGDRDDERYCLGALGYTYRRRREDDKGLDYYQQSLTICRELGDRQNEGITLNNMAAIYDDLGKYEQALEQYHQSLSIKREVGDREGEGTTLNNIGRLYRAQGDNEKALQYYEQCLPIWRERGYKIGEGTTLNNIAAIYDAQDKPSKAMEYYKQSLAISRELGDRAGEAESCWNLGLTYIGMGDLAQAEEHITQAVELSEQIGHPLLEEWRDGLERVRAKRQGA
ncbi:MAG: tetratricopeptide repeat protein, partial [Candidatus Electrothrix sp. LOE1_4_5]|nr:tetratricopeptide repeat protein [Candidatus Electrothrix gigas]